MKIGKENMVGLVYALDRYRTAAPAPDAAALRPFAEAISALPGLCADIEQDEAGRAIWRIRVSVDANELGLSAREVEAQLRGGDIAIYARRYYLHEGHFSLDPAPSAKAKCRSSSRAYRRLRSMQRINFYRQRVAINVLAKDIANAREIYDAAEGHAVIGVLSAQFTSVEQGVAEVRRWMAEVPSISVGLGAGDPAQFYKAAMIAAQVHPAHVNQTFTGSGFAAGALAATGGQQTFINALVSPSGTPGEVRISTGVRSAKGIPAQVSCDAAVRMMLDMGAHAAKFSRWGRKVAGGAESARPKRGRKRYDAD